ncbi:hypothetical protein [Streptomyces sp. NPDC086989]|uniref:hypothetical protein n=1 Tax=Streptomyces sp. NPDC086989 TaxID=3365764 RepID=UPI00380E97E9
MVPALPVGAASALGLRTLEITEPPLRARVALASRTDGPSSREATVFLDLLRTTLTLAWPGLA